MKLFIKTKAFATAFVFFIGTAQATAATIFKLTPDQFNQQISDAIKDAGLPAPQNQPDELKRTDYGSLYAWKLSPLLSINGHVSNQTGLMTAAQLMTKGDGTAESGAQAMATAATFFKAARGNPPSEAETQESAKIVIELLNRLRERQNSFEEITVDDGKISYFIDYEQQAGTWFTIEPYDD